MKKLINKINALVNSLPCSGEPCDVCGSVVCICSYLPECGGKELEEWTEQELEEEVARLTVRSLNHFYRQKAEEELPKSTYVRPADEEDLPF